MMRQISPGPNIENATFFTIIADETADVSNKEQVVLAFRGLATVFLIHEDFIGMHPLERTNADQEVAILKNALLIINC